MRVVICDTDQVFLEKLQIELQKQFSKHNQECNFQCVTGGAELLDICREQEIDAVFMEPVLSGIDRFQTAAELRKLSKNIMLVFVSCKEDAVYESFEYNPLWFVPKRKLNMLAQAAEKVIESYNLLKSENRWVKLVYGKKLVRIDIQNTVYLKSEGHYIRIILKDGVIYKSFRCKLDDIEPKLAKYFFVRIHKRFLLNLRFAECISPTDMKLTNGEKIPISRSKVGEVKDKFLDYCRSVR
ncbi:MAG: response regulator transcription factor [Clostridia bacterium]|nr:response regulator transcription factor [Clostridia bacterium]MCI8979591.1 response regulator transcription factor [Clostridia bacterium]MCI9085800.1 response regulator transcription factor [Clostridia bacterium]